MISHKRIQTLLLVAIFAIGTLFASVPANAYDSVPAYSGKAWVKINGNKPYFTSKEKTTDEFVKYTPLDYLGRCGEAYTCISSNTLPTEVREDIPSFYPTG